MINLIVQISKYLPQFDDKWYISEEGVVYKSLKRNSDGRYNFIYKGERIRQVEIPLAIPVVYLGDLVLLEYECKVDKRQGYKHLRPNVKINNEPREVHRIVAYIFNGIDIFSLEVHHLDRDKLNNHKDNLIGLTNKEHFKEHEIDSIEVRKMFKSFDYQINGKSGTYTWSLKSFCELNNISYKALHQYIRRNPGLKEYNYYNLRIYNIVYK